MKKLNTKGFGLIEGLLILVIVGIVGGTGFYVYNANKKASGSSDGSTIVKKDSGTVAKEQAEDPYEGWLTYESKLNSGLTFRYPADWKFSQDPEIFKNDGGGESLTATLHNVEPKRKPGGIGAPYPASNIYMCVSFDEYGGDWSYSDWFKGEKPASTEQFKVNGQTLTLATYAGDNSMLSNMILSSTGTPDDHSVATNNGYIVSVNAQFNCTQADYEILKNNSEDFNQREEVKTAKLILKSINF